MLRGTKLPKPEPDESNPFLDDDGHIKPGILPAGSKLRSGTYINLAGSYALVVSAICDVDDQLVSLSSGDDPEIRVRKKRNLEKMERRLMEMIEGE